MRKVLEAYSTFNYGKGFKKAFNDDIFLLVPPEKRDNYKNLMYKLILDDDSHTEETIMAKQSAESNFSYEEKKKIAKTVLVLLFHIDELHLKNFLGNQFTIVKQWAEENSI